MQEREQGGARTETEMERLRALVADLPAELEGEERAAALGGATEAVEGFVGAWAEADWEAMVERLQASWRAHWADKVLQDEPEPMDARLLGEGEGGAGPTWKEATGGTVAGLLEQLMGAEEVVLHTVLEDEAKLRSAVMADVPVDVVLKDRMGQRRRERRVVRVIREDDDGRPAVEGAWGANPVSARRRR